MQKQPKISVVIPCHNAESSITTTLKSIFRQTLGDLEILCYDDASKDKTVEAIRSFNDDRIKIFEGKENIGPGLARNFCLERAKGKYIAFIDADDAYATDSALEKLYKAAKSTEYPIVCGSCQIWEDRTPHYAGRQTVPMEGYISPDDYQYSYGYWRGIYDNEFLQKNHIKFPEFRRYEDPVFFLEAQLKAGGIFFIKDNIINYNIGNNYYSKWSFDAIHDFCNGILENLKISRTNRFDNLEKLTSFHLTENNDLIATSFLQENDSIYELVKEINDWLLNSAKNPDVSGLSTFLQLETINQLIKGQYASYEKSENLFNASYSAQLKGICNIDPDSLDYQLMYLRTRKADLKEKVIQEIEKLKTRFPLSPASDLEISFLKEEFGNRELAIEYLQKSILAYPDSFRLREHLFYLLLKTENYKDAEQYLENVSSYYEIPLYRMKSAWAKRTGNSVGAKYYAEESIAEGWHDPWSYIWGYEVFSQMGDKKWANKILGKGLALFPMDPNLLRHFLENGQAKDIVKEELRLKNWTERQGKYLNEFLKVKKPKR